MITVKIRRATRAAIEDRKMHPRETIDDVLTRVLAQQGLTELRKKVKA